MIAKPIGTFSADVKLNLYVDGEVVAIESRIACHQPLATQRRQEFEVKLDSPTPEVALRESHHPHALQNTDDRGVGVVPKLVVRCKAVNIVRSVAWLEGKPLGKTRVSRFAGLAARNH